MKNAESLMPMNREGINAKKGFGIRPAALYELEAVSFGHTQSEISFKRGEYVFPEKNLPEPLRIYRMTQ